MKFFLLEIGKSEPRQFRVMALEQGIEPLTLGMLPDDDAFEKIGIYTYPECLHILESYLRLEHTK